MTTVGTRVVEREDEVAVLRGAISAAASGIGRVVVVDGPAGIGKTTLLRQAANLARDLGLTVARARATSLERDLPYGVIRQLFECFLAGRSLEARRELLAGAAHLAVPLFASAPVAGAAPPVPARPFAVLHGLYWLVANLSAENPLVVFVDDLHWADAPSAQFLAYLAHRIEDLPVTVIAAVRSGENSADQEALADLASHAVMICPAPLTESAMATMIESGFGRASAPAFTAACHRATGGNPFLVRELVTAMVEEKIEPGDASSIVRVESMRPSSLIRAVSRRLAQLPGPANELARAVAVLGDGAPVRLAAELAGLGPDRAAAAADALVTAGILVFEQHDFPAGLAFVHPLVRGAIEETIPSGLRAAAHSTAAELLTDHGADAGRISTHLLHAEPRSDPQRVEILREAARTALVQGAPALAVTCLRRAVSEHGGVPPGAVLRELGTAQARAGVAEAVDTLARAMEVAEDASDMAFSALERGRALVMAGRAGDASAVCAQAARQLGPHPDLAEMLLVEELVNAHTMGSVHGRLRRHFERYPDGEGPLRPPARIALAMAAIEETMVGDSPERTAGRARRALGDGELLALVGPEAPVMWAAVIALALSGQLSAARREATRAMAAARELGSAAGFAMASATRGWFWLFQGALDEAESDARAAVETPTPAELWAFPRSIAIATLAETLLARGAVAEADAVFDDNPISLRAREVVTYDLVLMARGRVRASQRRPLEALEDFREAGRRHAAWGATTSGIVSWRSAAAEALMAMGDREQAAALAGEELVSARSYGAARQVGIALRACAAAAENPEAIDLLRQAVAVLEPSEARLEHAGTLVDLGSALRRAGNRSDARKPLREGLDLAVRSGAETLADRARAEIEATGVRVGREAVSGPASLTPCERRVVGYASEGQSNREIAQALFVSLGTVELHLTSSYRKLGIRSRRQLPSILSPPGG